MGDLVIERIQANLLNCLEDMDDVIEYCQDLLTNNNVIILIEKTLYHEFKTGCRELSRVRDKLYDLYLKIEQDLNLQVLDLTLEGYDWIEHINQILITIEEKWNDGDIDVNKYFLAQRVLGLKLPEKVVLDIDDLELVQESKNMWICAYVVKEGKNDVCHLVSWETKQEALMFAMQSPFCRRDLVFNKFTTSSNV